MTPLEKKAFLAAVVKQAALCVGQQEQPKYSNWGPSVQKYLAAVGVRSPASWCAAFAYWCFLQKGCVGNLIKTGYCPSQVEHARSLGVLVDANDVASGKIALQPGWLMFEWIPSEGGYHHTGIVEIVGQNGQYGTIEGNTNTDGGNEGYEVARQRRVVSDKASDGHNKYCFMIPV